MKFAYLRPPLLLSFYLHSAFPFPPCLSSFSLRPSLLLLFPSLFPCLFPVSHSFSPFPFPSSPRFSFPIGSPSPTLGKSFPGDDRILPAHAIILPSDAIIFSIHAIILSSDAIIFFSDAIIHNRRYKSVWTSYNFLNHDIILCKTL